MGQKKQKTDKKNESVLEQARARQNPDIIDINQEITGPDNERLQGVMDSFVAGNKILSEDQRMRVHFQDSPKDKSLNEANSKGTGSIMGDKTVKGIAIGLTITILPASVGAKDIVDESPTQTAAKVADQAQAQGLVQQLELEEGNVAQVDVEAFGPMEDNDLSAYEYDAETGEVDNNLPITETAEALDAGKVDLGSFLSNPEISKQVKAAVLYETDAVDANNATEEKPRLEVARQLAQGEVGMAQSIIDDNRLQAFQDTVLDDWTNAMEERFGLKIEMENQDEAESVEGENEAEAQQKGLEHYQAGQIFEINGQDYMSVAEPLQNKADALSQAEAQGLSGDNAEAPSVEIDGQTYYVPSFDHESTLRVEFEKEGDEFVLNFPNGGSARATLDEFEESDEYDFIRNAEMEAVGVYSSKQDTFLLPKKSEKRS